MITTPDHFFDVVGLFNMSQGGMGGFAALPDPGGLNDQPAWLLDAFNILAGARKAHEDFLKGLDHDARAARKGNMADG